MGAVQRLGRPLSAFPLVLTGALLFFPSLFLLCVSQTARGRALAVGGLCWVVGCVVLSMAIRRGARRWKRWLAVSMGFIAFGVGIVAFCIVSSPSGVSEPDAAFRQVYLGSGGFRRWAVSNMVPEEDQFRACMFVFGLLDSSMTGERGRALRHTWEAVYREMERDPEFRVVGSSMQHAYAERLPGEHDVGHMYVYVPPDAKRPIGKRMPVILFLHGSLGNFQGYIWVWKAFADAHGFAVVAPSFGLGNWQRLGGTEAIERARRWCVADARFDPNRVYLACLSNGGRGLMRAAIANPDAYCGLISISGYLEPELVSSKDFARGWRGRPMLVLHGGRDDRVPLHEVTKCADRLALDGVNVRRVVLPEADHFVFFTDRERMVAEIGEWVGP